MKHLSWTIAPIVVLAAATAAAQSGVVKGDHVGCLTAKMYDDYAYAKVGGDWQKTDEMINSLCFGIEGREFTVIESSFFAVQIEVMTADGAVTPWTGKDVIR